MEFVFIVLSSIVFYISPARPFWIQGGDCGNKQSSNIKCKANNSVSVNKSSWQIRNPTFVAKPNTKEIFLGFDAANCSYEYYGYEVNLYSSPAYKCKGRLYNRTCIRSEPEEKIFVTYQNVPSGNYCVGIEAYARYCTPCKINLLWIIELTEPTITVFEATGEPSGENFKNSFIYPTTGALLSLLLLIAFICFIFRLRRRKHQFLDDNKLLSLKSEDPLLNDNKQRSVDEIEKRIQNIINSKPSNRVFILHCVGDEHVDRLVEAFVQVLEENFFCQIVYSESDREITEIQRMSKAIWTLQNINTSDKIIVIETDYACKVQHQLTNKKDRIGNNGECIFLHGLVSIINSQKGLADNYSQLFVVKFDSTSGHNQLQRVADHCRFFLPSALADLFINLHNIETSYNLPELTTCLTAEEIREVWREKSSSYRLFMQKCNAEVP